MGSWPLSCLCEFDWLAEYEIKADPTSFLTRILIFNGPTGYQGLIHVGNTALVVCVCVVGVGTFLMRSLAPSDTKLGKLNST